MNKLFLVLFLMCSVFSVVAKEDSPPVIELKNLLKSDPLFSKKLQAALDNVKDLPGGTPNPWRGKSEEQLFNFLNDWYYFLPTKNTGLDKIMEFSFLYYKNPKGLEFINEEPGLSWANRFVELRGKYMDSKDSVVGVKQWLNDKSIDHSDFVVPANGYQSFNEYFIREIKPGVRPISEKDNPNVVVSPADCIINHIDNELSMDTAIPTKGRMSLNLSQLLNNSKFSNKFVGGSAYACFLLPENYHHYHSPVTGTVVESNEHVGHKLFGLSDLIGMANNGNPGKNKDFSVFEDFKHGYLIIETESMGYVAVVPVGLQTVGSVVFEKKFSDLNGSKVARIEKGEKFGHFAYGGSTVLLLFEKDRFKALSVKQGQRIGEAH